MTIKLVVLYAQPDDAEAFDRHYADVHAPLARQMPGLQRLETGRLVTALDGGEHTYHFMAELFFADQDAMGASFGSEEGRATAADYGKIAPPGSRMYVQSVDE